MNQKVLSIKTMTSPETSPKKARDSVRRTLVAGVFWRILIIEMILLVWSLGYRAATEGADATDLFWFAVRVIILVAIIIAFVTYSLSSFLQRKIILPLETIARANLGLDTEAPTVNNVDLPEDTPKEITEIVDTRQRMLEAILKVSGERLRLVEFIRKTFGRYLSQKVVDEILASPDGHKIGGRRETVTILMADLRGFTSIADTSDPEETVRLLNRFFGAMAKIITAYDGMIDEFLGDGILVIFGVPQRHEDDPYRAVACALEMQNAMLDLNTQLEKEGISPLEMGIGINTGTVIAGNIGSEIRSKYGIVGLPVNTASRIESLTTGGQVLIGEPTYRIVASNVRVDQPQTVMMKGLKHPLVCFPVKAITGPYQVELNIPAKTKQPVEIQLSMTCWIMDGKKVIEPGIQGQTLFIDGDEWTVTMTPSLIPLTDVKIQLDFCSEAHCFGPIYAKAIDTCDSKRNSSCRLRITAITQQDRDILDGWAADLIKNGALTRSAT